MKQESASACEPGTFLSNVIAAGLVLTNDQIAHNERLIWTAAA